MYDEELVALGEPTEKVYSAIHLRGKEKARRVLAARRHATEQERDDGTN